MTILVVVLILLGSAAFLGIVVHMFNRDENGPDRPHKASELGHGALVYPNGDGHSEALQDLNGVTDEGNG